MRIQRPLCPAKTGRHLPAVPDSRLPGNERRGAELSRVNFKSQTPCEPQALSPPIDRQAIAADWIADDLPAHPRLDGGATLGFGAIAADDFGIIVRSRRQIAMSRPARSP